MFLESDGTHKKIICPIKGIEQYLDVARQIRVDLTRGYLFRCFARQHLMKALKSRFSLQLAQERA